MRNELCKIERTAASEGGAVIDRQISQKIVD